MVCIHPSPIRGCQKPYLPLASIILVSFIILACCISRNHGNIHSKRLYDHLLLGRNYNKLIRPVNASEDKVIVKIGLKLTQLIDLVRSLFEFLFDPGSVTSLALKLSFGSVTSRCLSRPIHLPPFRRPGEVLMRSNLGLNRVSSLLIAAYLLAPGASYLELKKIIIKEFTFVK